MFRLVFVNTLLNPNGPTNSTIPRSITLEIVCPSFSVPVIMYPLYTLSINHFPFRNAYTVLPNALSVR